MVGDLNKRDLDNYITGHGGEDQFKLPRTQRRRLPHNQYVSKRAMRLLTAMRDDEDYDHELVGEKGVWMVGLKRFAWVTVQDCLLLCLLKCEAGPEDGFERYALNGDGRGVLTDPNYRPAILDARRPTLKEDS